MQRDTSVYERVMFFHASKRPMYFAFHLKVMGEITALELERSLDALRVRYPSSAVRVGFGPANQQFITTQGVPPYPVKVLEAGVDWRVITAQELIVKMDDSCGPMVRFLLIPGSGETELIAIFHHAICDGVSAVIFLKDLFRALEDPAALETMKSVGFQKTDWEPILTECLRDEVRRDFEESALPDWLKYKLHLNMESQPCPRQFQFLEPSFDIQTIELDEAETTAIQGLSKKWEVSVHSLLGAVMLSSFAARFGKSLGYERIIQSPVNFRSFVTEDAQESFGLFMGIIKEKIDCSPGRTFKEIASQINSKFRVKINSTDSLKPYYMFMTHMLSGETDPESFFYSRPKNDFMDYDFSLSNLGKITFPDRGEKLQVLEFHGPIFSAVEGERIFGVNTTNGRMTISMIYDYNCFCSKKAGEIFGEIGKWLRTAGV